MRIGDVAALNGALAAFRPRVMVVEAPGPPGCFTVDVDGNEIGFALPVSQAAGSAIALASGGLLTVDGGRSRHNGNPVRFGVALDVNSVPPGLLVLIRGDDGAPAVVTAASVPDHIWPVVTICPVNPGGAPPVGTRPDRKCQVTLPDHVRERVESIVAATKKSKSKVLRELILAGLSVK